MSLFRSLYNRYDQDESHKAGMQRPWPATYRGALPHINVNDYALHIRIENQHAKVMNRRQLSTLPTFNENRRITSQAGWTYYGAFKGLTFQTLFSLFTTPQLYPWVRIESLTGDEYIIERTALLNYRVLMECDGEPLSPLYGGPLWIHNFDYYIEFGIPNVKSIVLMQGEHAYTHPNQALGYDLEHARVEPGRYYAVHHDKIATL